MSVISGCEGIIAIGEDIFYKPSLKEANLTLFFKISKNGDGGIFKCP
jgi:hypothetical protein